VKELTQNYSPLNSKQSATGKVYQKTPPLLPLNTNATQLNILSEPPPTQPPPTVTFVFQQSSDGAVDHLLFVLGEETVLLDRPLQTAEIKSARFLVSKSSKRRRDA